MKLSERFDRSGESCYKIAESRSLLTGAFIAAVVTVPFSSALAIGCLGAPAIYGALGGTQKAIAKGIELLSPKAN